MKRIVSFLILLIILAGLCVYYYDHFTEHEKYPSIKSILTNYPEGKTVYVSGVVYNTFNGGFKMQQLYHGLLVNFTVISNTPVKVGDSLSILGVLGPNYQITASQVVAVNMWRYEFVFFRSFLALLVLFAIFWMHWKFDFENFEFIRRKPGKGVKKVGKPGKRFNRRMAGEFQRRR